MRHLQKSRKKFIPTRPRLRRNIKARPFMTARRWALIIASRRIIKNNQRVVSNRTAKLASGYLKNILVSLRRRTPPRKRVAKKHIPRRRLRAIKPVPRIVSILCNRIASVYSVAKDSKYTNFYTALYMSKSKDKPKQAAQLTSLSKKISKTSEPVKKIEPPRNSTNIPPAYTKSNTGKTNTMRRHSKNWIDPEIWSNMSRKERDAFLVKTGKHAKKRV